MAILTVSFGVVIGLSMGLTGGGGAIFGVPLLVYGINMSPQQAVGTSLVAVGFTALVGFLSRWRAGQVDLRIGLIFALAGMAAAPVGTWLAGLLHEAVLLLLFVGLMVVVAMQLWVQAARTPPELSSSIEDDELMSNCNPRDATNGLMLSTSSVGLLTSLGLLTGVLTGLFGIGGGFIIVPALVFITGITMQRAVGTSLFVIALVSISGTTSYVWTGRTIDPVTTGLFVLGSLIGLFTGQEIGRRLHEGKLQRAFAVLVLLVAAFMSVRTLIGNLSVG